MEKSKGESSGAKKLKILCLHGFYQNADVFRIKTGSFRKYYKQLADFEFLDAPHEVVGEIFSRQSINNPEDDTADNADKAAANTDEGPHLAWWETVPDWLTTQVYPGVEKSIEKVKRFVEEKGPFDGLLGFSQGGVFSAILCNTNIFNFRFVIISSAFVPSIPEFIKGPDHNTIPSLHLYGRNDTLVKPAYSQELSSYFKESVAFEHKGGHFVPTDSESKKVIRKFLESFL